MVHLGDITKIDWSEAPPVDCVTGGSPCQNLSIAGDRTGLSGKQSSLFMEQIRCIKELRAADEQRGRSGQFIRPRYMVWENVPGALSSNDGEDFRTVLEETVRIVLPGAVIPRPPGNGKWRNSGAIVGDGWSLAWRIHDAQFWGVPQRRRRVALVCDFGGLNATEILFESQGLRRYSEESGASGQDVTTTNERSADFAVYDARGGGNGLISCTITGDHQNRVTDYTALCVGNGQLNQIPMSPIANTLDTMHDQQAILVGKTIRRLTPLEVERLQGYPDGWTDIGEWTDDKGKKRKASDSQRFRALGNSLALPFWFWLLRRISAQYYRPATLGSLFSGLGGFELCWERCNGPGTALWASEVEPFCVAITTKRFSTDTREAF